MAHVDWLLARNIYLSDRFVTLAQVAAQVHVSPVTLRLKAGKEKWFQQKQEILKQVEERVLANQKEQIADKLYSDYVIKSFQ